MVSLKGGKNGKETTVSNNHNLKKNIIGSKAG